MTYLMEVPVEGGGRLVLEASRQELPDDLELAALRPGEIVTRLGESLESALETIKPSLRALRDALISMAPQEVSVEFGLSLGGETGVIVAKGTGEVHFVVTMSWKAD